MNNSSKVIGVKKLTPIIDFNCIVDTEYGLLQLIYDQYYDLSVFNQEKFEMPTNKILLELHNRKDKNPLIPFVNKGISKEDADDYYSQFMNTKYEDIIARSIGTNMQTVLTTFNQSNEVFSSILCHNELEKNYISDIEDFKSNTVYLDEEFVKVYKNFNQIYLRYIDDLDIYIRQCLNKNVYFSSSMLNMKIEEDGLLNLKDNKNLNLLSYYSKINIYDLYNMDFLKGETNDSSTV